MKQTTIIATAIFLLTGCGGATYKKRQTAITLYRQASLEAKEYQDKRDINSLHKALNNIDKSLTEHQTVNALALKATILLQLGELASAIPIFEHVIKDSSVSKAKRADTQNNLASALYQSGKYDAAKKLWLELANNPHYISPEVAWYNLGYAELNEAYGAAYKDAYNRKEINQYLERAVSYFKQALGISREFIDAHFYLGKALAALERWEEANEHFLAILTINPEHKPAQAILQQLEEKMAHAPKPERK